MKGNILVLENEFGPREALRLILSEEHRVLTASTGERALALLAREPVDVMTMSMLVPDFEGSELLRVIRKGWKRVQIIVVTGDICLETASKLLQSGVSDIIAKPFHPIEIRSVVDRALAWKKDKAQNSRGFSSLAAPGWNPLRGEPTVSYQLFQREEHEIDPCALDALVIFSKAIETRHAFSKGHSERVCGYLKAVCPHLPMKPREKEELEVAALLHDIGKFSLPYQRVYKNAPLDDEDWAMVRLHPQKSVEFIRPAP
jgi:response regulator RpfG family c-di-GMP phosphodiesterase